MLGCVASIAHQMIIMYTIDTSREIKGVQMLHWNVAEEYANLFQVPGRTAVETGWQFRERVARYLQEMGNPLLAHEVLFNRRMSGDPFARLELSSGFSEEFVTQISQQTEVAFQKQRKQQAHREKQQRLLSIIRFWQKSEV